MALASAGLVPWAPVTDEEAERLALRGARPAARAAAGPGGFAEHLDRVPVLLLLLADLGHWPRSTGTLGRYTFAGGASIYPFAWNLLLAARAEGLAGVMTTMPIRREEEVKELVGGSPPWPWPGRWPSATPCAGHGASAGAVEEFATIDRCDGPFFPFPPSLYPFPFWARR